MAEEREKSLALRVFFVYNKKQKNGRYSVMKKTTGRFLSLLLAAALLLSSVPLSGVYTEADAKTYKTGDIITFGGYPQTRVTDSKTLSALDKLQKNWVSYRYYSGKDTRTFGNGSMRAGDWMRYADFRYNGSCYRAVTFDNYRPFYTDFSFDAIPFQKDNGYYRNTVYYFKYEPLKWRVLDPDAGLVLCESIIDSQAFQNTVYYDTNTWEMVQGIGSRVYATDYTKSTIRQWLLNDFYKIAFSSAEQPAIADTKLDNSCPFAEKFSSASTTDKVFLLSYDEARNTAYGFNSSKTARDTARCAKGTDYAKCQGLLVSNHYKNSYYGNSDWWLRTPARLSSLPTVVWTEGTIWADEERGDPIAHSVFIGVRPAFRFKSGIAADNNPLGGHAVSVLPGDVDGNGKVEAADARLALRAAVGLEKYAKGSVKFRAADASKDGVLKAEDARLILRAAVGLEKLK